MSMKSVVDNSKLDYLLHSRRSFMLLQRATLVAESFEDIVVDIAMNSSAFTDDNARAYDPLIPGIFRTLAEQVLKSTIKNENKFQGYYKAFQALFMGVVSMTCIIMIATTAVYVSSRFNSCKGNVLVT